MILQPVVARKLAAGGGHARDQRTDPRRPLGAIEAQGFELLGQSNLLQGCQRDMLDRHGAWTQQIQGVDIDRVIVRRFSRPTFIDTGPGVDQLCRITLRRLFPLGIEVRGHQIRLATDDLIDALHQRTPLRARDLEMPSQVQQRALAYLLALADRLHQPVRVVRLPGASALDRGAADIHTATVASSPENSNGDMDDYGTTLRFY